MELINYAHRGASGYAPENTFAAFYLGQRMGANGIETDVQRTRDGVLVLFHDNNSMLRTAGRPEAIQHMTYAQLLELDLGAYMGKAFAGERIVTLEEFLRHFGGKALHLAIEIKEYGVEADTLALIDRYCRKDHVIVTSGNLASLREMHRLDPDMRLGYLTRIVTDSLLDILREDGIGQICPQAPALTPEVNRRLREQDFSVRPWGITDDDVMRRMLDLRVDGMTTNWPDHLAAMLRDMPAD